MTAEIAVMNEEAVALAADSAVSGPKIFTSANKIFALSKYHPVAIMINDRARFMGVPWETIIKSYRAELGDRSFPTLAHQAANFLGYFDRPNPLFPNNVQLRFNGELFSVFFDAILAEIDRRLEERLAKGEGLTQAKIGRQVAQVIGSVHSYWTGRPIARSLPADHPQAVRAAYKATIERAINETFKQLPLSAQTRQQLSELAGVLLGMEPPNPLSPCHSGVVIAGFGADEYFPSLYEFEFDTIALNRLKYFQGATTRIGPERETAAVRAFAQHDQVGTFMNGIDGALAAAITEYWRRILPDLINEVAGRAGLDKAARRRLGEEMGEWCAGLSDTLGQWLTLRQQEVNAPILRVVTMMPKDELAAMAESLVNLTSFKRKVTEEAETVGGPIDVAVISKGDGLIWVKRKHYFEPDRNPQFFANYYPKRVCDASS